MSLRWKVAQFLERRWWRGYLRDKSPADYLADKKAYWARVLNELDWTPQAGRVVLDAGCGPAGVFIHLHDRENVTALDPLLVAYESDLDVFRRGDYPNVEFIETPLENYRADRRFAAIYCFNAINHVRDWDAVLDRLTALAAPGARMILTSDVHRSAFLQRIFAALPGDVLHPQQHLPDAYREALQKRGWTIEREQVLRREAIFDYTAWVVRW